MTDIQDKIIEAKDKMPNVTPIPPEFHPQATAHELKARLQWGEPGLTLVDVRDHDTFNQCRIRGAMSMPADQLADMASNLPKDRDIYVYGASDDETAEAANLLRGAGFSHVAELKGGLASWKEIDGYLEGAESIETPGDDAYNVFARMEAFGKEKAKEEEMK